MHGQSFRWDADSSIAARGFPGYLLIPLSRFRPTVEMANASYLSQKKSSEWWKSLVLRRCSYAELTQLHGRPLQLVHSSRFNYELDTLVSFPSFLKHQKRAAFLSQLPWLIP